MVSQGAAAQSQHKDKHIRLIRSYKLFIGVAVTANGSSSLDIVQQDGDLSGV